jgi:hypothetical protein
MSYNEMRIASRWYFDQHSLLNISLQGTGTRKNIKKTLFNRRIELSLIFAFKKYKYKSPEGGLQTKILPCTFNMFARSQKAQFSPESIPKRPISQNEKRLNMQRKLPK